jgi:RNA polymerase sigma factor for flagellar operon FliA
MSTFKTSSPDDVLAPPVDEHTAVTTHRAMVNRIAATLARRAGPVAEIDDLVAAGLLGVVRAARTFDPGLGVPFELFVARHARWAMLTELRGSHPLRRGVSDRRRQLQKAEERLVHRLHHAPTAADLAAELDTPESVVARWQAEIAAAERHPSAARLAPRPRSSGVAGQEPEEEVVDGEPLPDEVVLDLELLAALHRAIEDLPPRLALIVRATYFEGRRLAEVALELGVTESRISQLRTEAVTHLRHQMQRLEHQE